MTPRASEATRPATTDSLVQVPTEPPLEQDLAATWRIGRFRPYRIRPLYGIRPLVWSFTETHSVSAATVGDLRAYLVRVLEDAGLSVRTQSVDSLRPADSNEWAPNEFVLGEKSIRADRARTRPSNAVVLSLYSTSLALLIVGLVGGIAYGSASLGIPGIFLGFILGLGVWMFTSNAKYWSDFVLVAFQRSLAAPPHTKKISRQTTGKVTVTAGRLFSQDYRGRGGGVRELREIYDSGRAADAKARWEEAISRLSPRTRDGTGL